jgi:hypothetical protein
MVFCGYNAGVCIVQALTASRDDALKYLEASHKAAIAAQTQQVGVVS